MKRKGEILDLQISEYMVKKDIDAIKELLGFEFDGEIFLENGLFSSEFLKEMMIKRDEIVYGLKNIKRSETTSSEVEREFAETQREEEKVYNIDMTSEVDDITVVDAKGENGRPLKFYYYNYNRPEKKSVSMMRQLREMSKDGKVSSIERLHAFGSNYLLNSPENRFLAGLNYLDGSLLVTLFNEKGKKQAALYQDAISGCTYYEYDKNGEISMTVNEDAVSHKVNYDGIDYTVYDGYLEKSTYGYVVKRYEDGKTIQDVKPSEIVRFVNAPDPSVRDAVRDMLDQTTQENVLGILKSLDPIFLTMYNMDDIEVVNSDKMEKLVTWLGNFSKRLRINPKLANQDKAVMGLMSGAVGRNIEDIGVAESGLISEEKSKQEQGQEL